MPVLQLDRVSLSLAGRPVLRDISWQLGERDRVGLVGPNGSGKSTLLKLLVGEHDADSGALTRPRGTSLGYLPQQVEFEAGVPALEAAMVLPPELSACEAELARIEDQLADPAVAGDERRLARVLASQERAIERYEALAGSRHASRVRELLTQLGLERDQWHLEAAALSGGQQKLVALARLAVEQPDVLLLDEPDNHLDIEAKHRLESFIERYEGAVVLVSHDRYLLDETVLAIAELAGGRLTHYKGNYSAYQTERELALLRQRHLHAVQQKEIARIEASIARFELWASLVVNERHIKQARSRRKQLERMEASGELVDAVRDERRMKLDLAGWRGSDKALEILDLSMGFGDDLLFTDVDLLVRRGERVGLIGANGAGKSVLFQLVLGQLAPLSGAVSIGPSTRVGYYAQQHETLDAWLDRTPLERVRDVAPMSEGAAVSFLLKFLFRYEQVRQPVRTLSGGERSRLQLASLVLERPNLLLLDEPTNNLDIPSAEVLEAALDGFEGAILVISHDRYFLDRVVDRVAVLQGGELREYAGGYTDYHEAPLPLSSSRS
jgi:ATP-binding cassette subfamily F protein 3